MVIIHSNLLYFITNLNEKAKKEWTFNKMGGILCIEVKNNKITVFYYFLLYFIINLMKK